MIEFNEERIERYSRHILLSDVGVEGQEKLFNGSVLVIGAGGLGAPVSLYLAAAGVGHIGLVDGDKVEISNLQRQVCHFTPDINERKVRSAENKMKAINPDIRVSVYDEFVSKDNILDIIAPYDFIIDGTDNLGIKFLINDACVLSQKRFSHGGILRYEGQTITVTPRKSACVRCLFFQPPPPDAVPTCSQAGVLGAIAGMLGTIQATEALKSLLGNGELLEGRLLSFDAKAMKFREVSVPLRSDCGCMKGDLVLSDPEAVVCDLKKGGA